MNIEKIKINKELIAKEMEEYGRKYSKDGLEEINDWENTEIN